jgi:hypothetical protein
MSLETKLTPVKIGLSEMLESLWDEIQEAATKAQIRGDSRFVFEEAEIEVAIAVEAESKTKFSLHVVEFGAGLTGTRTATLRIKVKQYTASTANDGTAIFLVDPKSLPGEKDRRPESIEEARRAVGAPGKPNP